MPGTLQNKLQQFEVTPPPSVWNKIATRLDEEFVPNDSLISSKMNDVVIAPPQAIWENIQTELAGETSSTNKRSKIVPIFYRSVAAAAVIAAISFGVFYFLRTDTVKQPEIVQNTPAVTQKSLPVEVKPPAAENQIVAAAIPAKRKNAIKKDPSYAPLYELNTVSAIHAVAVSAPPLRDKSGNLILDLATISNADDRYITVTGPNGKQTKISSKFLSCLGYINANLSSSDMDYKALRCTMQFEEWRQKLLSEPAFIPTANNFFDIFELKDMLQEM